MKLENPFFAFTFWEHSFFVRWNKPYCVCGWVVLFELHLPITLKLDSPPPHLGHVSSLELRPSNRRPRKQVLNFKKVKMTAVVYVITSQQIDRMFLGEGQYKLKDKCFVLFGRNHIFLVSWVLRYFRLSAACMELCTDWMIVWSLLFQACAVL